LTALTIGKALDQHIFFSGQADERQLLGRLVAEVLHPVHRRPHAPLLPTNSEHGQRNVLKHREFREHAGNLEGTSYAFVRPLGLRQMGDVFAKTLNDSAGGAQGAADAVEQGSFSRSVRADHHASFTWRDFQADAADRSQTAEGLDHRLERQRRLGHCNATSLLPDHIGAAAR